jgi:tripartite-type tricarboxylate transporter receptor subunit TctC
VIVRTTTKETTMTSILRIAVGATMAALACCGSAQAQSWPTKPVRVVVAFTAGGTTDILTRNVGQQLGERLRQPFVVDNKPGAGGNLGTEFVVRAPADGYTLMVNSVGPIAVNPTLYPKLPYNPLADLVPIVQIADVPNVLVVHPSLPVKNVKELIALAKARPGQIAYGSSGNGTILHLSAEYFNSVAGTKMIHVPYKGSAPAVQALLGGEVALVFSSMPPAIAAMKAGRVRALGVTTPRRVEAAPEVPTISESGLKGYEIVLYSGILGPGNLPAGVTAKLNAELTKLVGAADFRQTLLTAGAEGMTSRPEEFRPFLEREIAKLARIVKESGAKVD